MNEELRNTLAELIQATTDLKSSSLRFNSVGGGCINECFRVSAGEQNFFLKLNSASRFPGLFEKERDGLKLLKGSQTINVPTVIDVVETNKTQFLLMEWVNIGEKTEPFWKQFGEQLAKLHQKSWKESNGEPKFGLDHDNYIGSMEQSNQPADSWIDFFIHQRLEPQIKIAGKLLGARQLKQFESIFGKLGDIFPGEPSSLLHGDLWAGNYICNENSEPVLIDPAVYYGHRSMDLAMTTLFGGFDHRFYEAYNYHYPLPANYRDQWDVCNLYPLLIHLNLFGSGYLRQIETILKKYG